MVGHVSPTSARLWYRPATTGTFTLRARARDGGTEVRADGTATLEVRPEAPWRLLFGRRLEIEIEWTIEQQTLAFHTVGGRPAAQVKLVNEMYGNQRVYQIENMSTDELILLDEQGERCEPWQRIDADAEGSVPQDPSVEDASPAARPEGEIKAARGRLSYH